MEIFVIRQRNGFVLDFYSVIVSIPNGGFSSDENDDDYIDDNNNRNDSQAKDDQNKDKQDENNHNKDDHRYLYVFITIIFLVSDWFCFLVLLFARFDRLFVSRMQILF